MHKITTDPAGNILLARTSKGIERGPRLDIKTVLLHEYTHHFMYQYFPAAYPTWYSEGFAEFMASPVFNDDGSIGIGAPPEYRGSARRFFP